MNNLSKSNNITNTPFTNFLSHTNQDYYDQRDQHYITCKYNGSLEQVTLELVPDIILEEEEEYGFYQWVDKYDQWDNTSYISMEEDETGGSHTFNVDNYDFNITKSKQNRKLKTRIGSEVSELNDKLNFYISKH